MASPMKFNNKSPTIKRILREAAELSTTPSPDFHASPASDSNLFEWHFTLRGPPSSPFQTGIYHGRIILPPTYPLRPPSFRFLTPSGRFETNREICLSISGHHEETWQPAWGIRTALVALRAFMETDAKGQLGGLDTSSAERERCALGSGKWTCGTCARSNVEILKECEEAAKLVGGGERVEETVPEGLVIGSKEDIRAQAKKGDGGGDEGSEGESTAELAEGFVQTVPVEDSPYPAARPAQTVPQPTGRAEVNQLGQAASANLHEQARSTQVRRPQPQQGISTDGIPAWIDKAIAGIAICLVALIMKMLLGF